MMKKMPQQFAMTVTCNLAATSLCSWPARWTASQVVAKFARRCERRTNALVAESIALMFAAELDLPVPEPFIVRMDPDLDLLLRESIAGWPAAT
jgi:hypothetical protein